MIVYDASLSHYFQSMVIIAHDVLYRYFAESSSSLSYQIKIPVTAFALIASSNNIIKISCY